MYRQFVKPLLDRVLALALLILLTPVLAIVAISVQMLLGSPVIFRQKRPGLGGSVFTLFKFKTMHERTDEHGRLLPDGARLTTFGKLLRSTSLDELPELVNVLKGEMSLVGPRPLLCEYLQRYSGDQNRRHEVKPGITGWAQVNGRNSLQWEERFRLDVWYVDHCSAWLDVKILCMTVWKTLLRQDISETGEATAREFMGSPPR